MGQSHILLEREVVVAYVAPAYMVFFGVYLPSWLVWVVIHLKA